MAFQQDGILDADEARELYGLIAPGPADVDMVMMIERKGAPIEGESPRQFEDGKPRMEIGGYLWSAQTVASGGKTRVSPMSLLVARRSDAATASVASILRAQDLDLRVVIGVYKAGGDARSTDAQPVFEMVLESARIAVHMLHSGGPWGVPSEIIAFTYRSIVIKSAPQTRTGARGAVRECKFEV